MTVLALVLLGISFLSSLVLPMRPVVVSGAKSEPGPEAASACCPLSGAADRSSAPDPLSVLALVIGIGDHLSRLRNFLNHQTNCSTAFRPEFGQLYVSFRRLQRAHSKLRPVSLNSSILPHKKGNASEAPEQFHEPTPAQHYGTLDRSDGFACGHLLGLRGRRLRQ